MIGLYEIWQRKTQFGLIALIVTLISYLILMVTGLGLGLNELAGSALRSFNADAIAYSDEAGISVIRSELSEETVERIRNAEGVTDSASLGYVAANYLDSDGEIASAAFLGYDPGTIGEPKVTSGDTLTPGDRLGLLADKRFLSASGLDVGDTVTVSLRLSKHEFRIVGEIDEGAFFFQPAVYVLRSTWQELRYGSIGGELPAASIVLLKGNGLAGREGPGYEIVNKATAFANIEGVAGQNSTVQSLRAAAFVIGALVIGVFFYVLTLQKVPQIGVLKAIGASNAFVFRQIVVQVLTLSAAGIAIAMPMAWLTEWALAQSPDSLPIAFSTGTYVTTAIGLVVTAVVGALFSGRQVLKTDPIIALGQQQ
ncbi:MAG: ABC transporter permease [Dehalococcoidia bacterium]|nr:ABC transporter permease [Dehalococcoidia bacterium]